MQDEQPPNSPYRSAGDHSSPSGCLFTCRPFPWRGRAATFLAAPAGPRLPDPSACHRWSPKPTFGSRAADRRRDCCRKRCQGCSAPRWAYLTSQLSSWGVNRRGDVAAGGWRGIYAAMGSDW